MKTDTSGLLDHHLKFATDGIRDPIGGHSVAQHDQQRCKMTRIEKLFHRIDRIFVKANEDDYFRFTL